MPLIGGSAAAVDLTPYLQKAGGTLTGPVLFGPMTIDPSSGRIYGSNVGLNYHYGKVNAQGFRLGLSIDNYDVELLRSAAGKVLQQFGTQAQEYGIARTVTGGGADYELFKLGWSGTTANLVTEAGGTGTERGINICSNGASLGFFEVGPVSQPATTNIAEMAHALSGSYTQAEIEAALDSLGTCINQLKGTLEALGLQAAS